jgi:hypothetical protein
MVGTILGPVFRRPRDVTVTIGHSRQWGTKNKGPQAARQTIPKVDVAAEHRVAEHVFLELRDIGEYLKVAIGIFFAINSFFGDYSGGDVARMEGGVKLKVAIFLPSIPLLKIPKARLVSQ